MGIAMIAVHSNGKENVGVRIMDINTKEIKDITMNSVISELQNGGTIENIKLDRNQVVGSNGSLDRYPKIIRGRAKGKSPLVVLTEVGDERYEVTDWKGKIAKYVTADLVKYSNKYGIANGKVVEKDGKQFISSITGNYTNLEIPTAKIVEKSGDTAAPVQAVAPIQPAIQSVTPIENSKPVVVKPVAQLKDTSLEIPLAKGIAPEASANQLFDKESGMTVEQKLVRSMLGMRNIRVFYYAMYITLKRVEDTSIDTAGVTTDTLHYNPEFIMKLSQPELMFLHFHVISHMAMLHNVRKGNRIHYLWNIACDLFINKLLSEEFGVKPGSGVNVVSEDMMGIGIQFIKGGLYEERIDIKTDTAESIYEELLLSYNQNKQREAPIADGEGNGGLGKSHEDGDDSNNEGDNRESKEKDKKEKESENEKTKEEVEYGDVEYKGKKVGKLAVIDIVTSEEDKILSDSQKEFKSKGVLERASMMNKQIGREAGGFLERMVKDALTPKISWRSLLKNKLTEATQKINTFSKPDRRFLGRGQILPGPKQLDLDKLKGVKVCIDTSGSTSDEDLGVALAQIKQLLMTYKADAELVYWDTQVRVTKEFKDVREMLSIKPAGGGGTDINCVFHYFDSKECKIKPTITIIFTDGCFTMPPAKYKIKYRDTIWVVTYNRTEFKPPFGLVADFRV